MARGDNNQVVYVDGDIPQLPLQLGQLLVDSSQISSGTTNLQQCTSQDPLTYRPIIGATPGDVTLYGASGDGATDDAPATEAASADSLLVHFPPNGTYLFATNGDFSRDDLVFQGYERASPIKMSGNNRRAFSIEGDNNTFESLYIDGQKPNVGWETTNNFDYAIRIGEFATSLQDGIIVRNSIIKDVGLDGINLSNTNGALIESTDFINCRRAGIAAIAKTYGLKKIVIRDCRFFCDFAGGPPGKERPLFALDIEPDAGNALTENVVIEGCEVYQGRLSIFSNPPSVISSTTLRGTDIYGTHGELAIDACAPIVTDVDLLDGAYALIDNAADSFPAQPYISNLASSGRTPKTNADGRVNLLPRDFIAVSDGSLSQGGTGSNSYSYLNLDGVAASVSNFAVGIGTGNSNVTIPTTVSIAADDNVWVILKVNMTAGDPNQSVVRVVYGTTIDRRYALSPGEQWIVVAVKAPGADVNPTFFFGVSGTVSVATSIRCTLAQVLVNPALVDMPSMRVAPTSHETEETVTYSSAMTFSSFENSTFVITANNGSAFTINAPTEPAKGKQITIRLRNTSGGALGAATWDAVFKMAAWTNPTNGNSRSITFEYDGTNWVEMTRTAADVPN